MSTLEEELHAALAIHVPSEERRIQIHALLAPLKYKSYATYPYYAHCIRVGLLSLKIARFTGNNEAEISVAGLLHDVGKALVDHRVLLRALGLEGAGPFTTEDMEEMKKHPMLGFQLLQGSFDTTAEIIVRHHSFQKKSVSRQPPVHRQPHGDGRGLDRARCEVGRISRCLRCLASSKRDVRWTWGINRRGNTEEDVWIESRPGSACGRIISSRHF